MDCLELRAGPQALAWVREHGLQADHVDLLLAASGGPKWLVLPGIDDWLARVFLPGRRRTDPLPVIGSSIGSWRAATLACADPAAARARLLEAYLAQRYPAQPTPAQVSAVCEALLEALLAGEDRTRLAAHPRLRLHVLVTGIRGLAADPRRSRALAGLALAALGNLWSPRLLGRRFERVVFHAPGSPPWTSAWRDLPTRHLPLDAASLVPALLASGSIPLLLEAVRLPAYPQGVLYDGGILDYHPLPRAETSGLVLYPHFHARVIPGWFDKTLRWRHSPAAALAHTLIVAPSAAWLARLPGGRIPDRRDFRRCDDAARQRAWRQVVGESARLGEALDQLVASGRIMGAVRPL